MNGLLALSRVIDAVTDRIGRVLTWFILAAVLISGDNAILRKVFNIGSNAWLEVQWYLFAAVFMLGAGYAFLKNAHVRIDFISGKLSARDPQLDRHRRHRRVPDTAVRAADPARLAAVCQRLGNQRDVAERRRPDPLAGACC